MAAVPQMSLVGVHGWAGGTRVEAHALDSMLINDQTADGGRATQPLIQLNRT